MQNLKLVLLASLITFSLQPISTLAQSEMATPTPTVQPTLQPSLLKPAKSEVKTKKKPAPLPPPVEFQLIKETQEIEGEPSLGSKEAYQTWKTACNEWKSELKELNRREQILSLDCGSPKLSRAEQFQKIYRSTAKYQIKVRMQTKDGIIGSSDKNGEDDKTNEDEDEDEDDDSAED
jgi:hypothetical protein